MVHEHPYPDQETALSPLLTQEAHTCYDSGSNCLHDQRIRHSEDPIHFFKLKAHTNVLSYEPADAIAKYGALHYYGHDKAFSPHSPDGNPFSQIHWLAK